MDVDAVEFFRRWLGMQELEKLKTLKFRVLHNDLIDWPAIQLTERLNSMVFYEIYTRLRA